jgi:hypothetical protein
MDFPFVWVTQASRLSNSASRRIVLGKVNCRLADNGKAVVRLPPVSGATSETTGVTPVPPTKLF